MEDLIGEYTATNPYYPKRGRLPFIVHSIGYGEYPINVSTVEYKGPKRIPVKSGYSEAAIRSLIERGIIRRRV